MGSGAAYRRILLTIALPDGPAPAGGALSIDKAAAAVASWWCDADLGGRAFTRHPDRVLATRLDVESLIHDIGLRRMGPHDVLAVYVTGHGRRAASGAHHLLLGRGPVREAYPTVEIVMAALGSAAEHVLVIVDSCHAGALHAEFARVRVDLATVRQKLTSLAVFTTADHDELPRVGEFAELLGRVDERLRTTAGYAAEHLAFDEFHAELTAAAAGRGAGSSLLEPLKLWPLRPSGHPSPCLPNPGYAPPDDVVARLGGRSPTPPASWTTGWTGPPAGPAPPTPAGTSPGDAT